MREKCYNHPERKVLSRCHSCKRYFCEECLLVGPEYYYCKDERCQEVYRKEMAQHVSSDVVTSKNENKDQEPKKHRSATLRLSGYGGIVGAMIALIGISIYVTSDFNPNKGPWLSVKQNLLIFVVTVVFYFIGSFVGYVVSRIIDVKHN